MSKLTLLLFFLVLSFVVSAQEQGRRHDWIREYWKPPVTFEAGMTHVVTLRNYRFTIGAGIQIKNRLVLQGLLGFSPLNDRTIFGGCAMFGLVKDPKKFTVLIGGKVLYDNLGNIAGVGPRIESRWIVNDYSAIGIIVGPENPDVLSIGVVFTHGNFKPTRSNPSKPSYP